MREEGFYWVRSGDIWFIDYWISKYKMWANSRGELSIEEIDEKQIKRE